ncbi:AP endonuclease, partial [Cronobacter sakazakii]
KDGETGAREGAKFIAEHIIKVSSQNFENYAPTRHEREAVRGMLGLEPQ